MSLLYRDKLGKQLAIDVTPVGLAFGFPQCGLSAAGLGHPIFDKIDIAAPIPTSYAFPSPESSCLTDQGKANHCAQYYNKTTHSFHVEPKCLQMSECDCKTFT